MGRAFLYLAFACSGAAALIYETAWTRLLTLFMGHTVAAASTVLAAFMGGLAIGAAVAGRVASTLQRATALRAYAAIEILIALFAIALPFELRLVEPILGATYDNGHGGAAFALVRLLSAIVVVTLPAIAMGATLPLVVRWDIAHAARAGRETGLLYAANTVGAAAGAVASGFVLLPAIGTRSTTMVGVGLNLISAAVGWWLAARVSNGIVELTAGDPDRRAASARPLEDRASASLAEADRRRRDAEPQRPKKKQLTRETAPASAPLLDAPTTAALALGISGCASLILQIAWTRILALVIGPTTFAFSAMVATFIAGISIGSLVGGWLARRVVSAWPLAWSLLIAALAACAAASYAPRVPLLVADAVAAPDATFFTVVRLQSLVVAVLMMPMTIAFGAAFPLAVGLAARADATVPRDVAAIYVANTVGAITGALLGGFVLVPRFGLQDTVRLAAAILVAGSAAVAIAGIGRRTATLVAGSVAAAALVVIWWLPPWDRELLSSGAYKYAPYMIGPHRDAMLRAGTLLYYREGAAATVSVRRLTGSVSLAIDGKVDASNAGDMLTQKLLAHVPLMLHPSPRRVGIIGLGSGVTLGAALRHPIEAVDMLEISPEVVEASRFFIRENHDALADRRTRLIVGDGRSHLLLGTEQYDVIVSEPSNPWMAGVASLFTREFFEAARERLAPGGILCQWAHTYDISDADLRSITATFTAVFPHAALWLIGDGDVLLTGSDTPIEPRLAGLAAAWTRPGVAGDLSELDVRDPESVLSLFTAGEGPLARYAGGASIQVDDRMALEFSGPRGIYGRTSGDNAAALLGLARDWELPPLVLQARARASTWKNRGGMQLRAEAYRRAVDDFLRALELSPGDDEIVAGLLKAAAAANRLPEAERALAGIVRRDPANVAAGVGLSRLVAARGDFVAAAEPLRGAFARQPPDIRAMDQLASLFADAGDADRLAAITADLQRLAPDADETLYYTASLHFLRSETSDAISTAERLLARRPRHAKGLNLLGAAYANSGRHDRARKAFEASLDADPRDPAAYTNLATMALQQGQPDAAAAWFAEALTLDPASSAAQEGLSRALAAARP